jgi:class 3 adenylate cyclase
MGDRRWRDLLDQHHQLMRTELGRFDGREISTTGDGFFASFERPVSAVRCALSMVSAVPSLGLQIRAGVHTGEVEVRGNDLGGLAVHIAARITASASGGEVLVSGTVKELLAGSGLQFVDRGEHKLKGAPDVATVRGRRRTLTPVLPTRTIEIKGVSGRGERRPDPIKGRTRSWT